MILVLCCPRTGSSLVAKIIAMHGVYTGEIVKNKFGYTEYENTAIKIIAKQQWKNYNKHRQKEFGVAMEPSVQHLQNVKDVVEKDIPKGEWLFKTMAELYPLFLQFNPKIILVKRNEESSVASIKDKHPKDDKEYIRGIYQNRMKLMKEIEHEHGAVWVDTDKLVQKDFTDIQNAVEYCGLEFNPEITDKAIDLKLWRH